MGSLFSREKPLMQTYGKSVLKGKTFSHADFRAVCSHGENLSSRLPGSLFSRGKPLIRTYGQTVLKGKTSHPDLRVVCSQGENLSSGLTGSLFSRGTSSLVRTYGQSVLKGKTSHADLQAVYSQGENLLSSRLTVLKGITFSHQDLLFSRGKPGHNSSWHRLIAMRPRNRNCIFSCHLDR